MVFVVEDYFYTPHKYTEIHQFISDGDTVTVDTGLGCHKGQIDWDDAGNKTEGCKPKDPPPGSGCDHECPPPQPLLCTTYLAAVPKTMKLDGKIFKGWKMWDIDGPKMTIRFNDGAFRNSTFDVELEDGSTLKIHMLDRWGKKYINKETKEVEWFQTNCWREVVGQGGPNPNYTEESSQGAPDPVCDNPK
jgi:hypothetical protein